MNKRILVVEDYDNTRLALVYQLQLAGYDVVEASSGEEALELLETHTFALVLTDIVLGAVSGIEVLHTARLHPSHPAVIVLTGHAALNSAIAAVNTGAAAYLLKPCPTNELLARVAQAIAQATAEQKLREAAAVLAAPLSSRGPSSQHPPPASGVLSTQHEIRVGDLILGGSRHDATYKNQPLNITPIEYALLYCLAQQPGMVHTYSDLVRFTHHIEVDEGEAQALLRPHIRNLRKKMEPHAIVTKRGTGYMLSGGKR